ncbi:unnamed protein product, partial [marine sediment metagenome]
MAVSDSKIKSQNPQHPINAHAETRNTKHETRNTKTWLSVDFDRIDYRDAWELQGNLIMARKERILPNDIVLFLEHPAVFTLGRRGGRECM